MEVLSEHYIEHRRVLVPLKKVGFLMQILASLEKQYCD